jgi:hypothetical protein
VESGERREPPVYRLRIRPLADPEDPRGIRRLKWLLKVTLRRLGFRCLGAVEEIPDQPRKGRKTRK